MGVWRDVARRFAFVEYDGPPLEPLELYTKKSGDEIVGQLYNFVDKGGREVSLRPEMTPTLARMASAKANALRKPVRWFSMPQLFAMSDSSAAACVSTFNSTSTSSAKLTSRPTPSCSPRRRGHGGCGLSSSDVRAGVRPPVLRAILATLDVTDENVAAVSASSTSLIASRAMYRE
jgi:hypothetical protein